MVTWQDMTLVTKSKKFYSNNIQRVCMSVRERADRNDSPL